VAFTNLLNHKCDVYHIRKTDTSPGYNLPSSPSFSYPDEPDIKDLICHFSVKSGGLLTSNVSQNEPYAILDGNQKLILPLSADVRLNDKIIDCQDGCEYTAGLPKKVRNHHKFVMLRRTDEQKPIGAVNHG